MKKISDLSFGFNDAVNYKKPENRVLFEKFFYKTEEFQKLFSDSIYFIVGEKGTGKTAYATYVVNNNPNNTKGFLNYISETDYQKFIKLKNDNHLQLSDYSNIWKVLIYLLIAERIKISEKENSLFKFSDKFQAVQGAIDEYYLNAFSPEIVHALNFVEKSKASAEVISKYFKALGEEVKEGSFTHSKFQTNLLYIQNHFEQAISSLKLKCNYILFIDGIDIRPSNVTYPEYLDCIKGLANAIWSLNNDFFPNNSKEGKIKLILLIRPDIFANLGLQNVNNKIKDNSILLDWRTNYPDYETSKLYALADRLLRSQQDKDYPLRQCWNTYFPYKVQSRKKLEHSFVSFLRFSLYRPRDIVTMLDLMKEIHTRSKDANPYCFAESDFNSSEFQQRYSDYLMGEIKDYLSFYYSDSNYELFRKFFDYLDGKKEFDYGYFLRSFRTFEEYMKRNEIQRPQFFDTPDVFLQFLFDLNVICYMEVTDKGKFIKWCFRERNYSNIEPKVKTGCKYLVHYGLLKSLNMGLDFRVSRKQKRPYWNKKRR